MQGLGGRPIPGNAALVVIAAGPSRLAAHLESHLRRPAMVLDAAEVSGWDFYEAPQ